MNWCSPIFFTVTVILAASAGSAVAAIETAEPDKFAAGEALTYEFDGAILTVTNEKGEFRFDSEVEAFSQTTSTTGNKVFARQLSGTAANDSWFFSSIGVPAVLRADFETSTDFVSIDMIRPAPSRDNGVMHAFNAEGGLLGSYIVDFNTVVGPVGTATLSRPGADIAYVLMGGYPPSPSPPYYIAVLDRLRFNANASKPPGTPWQMSTIHASSVSTLTVSIEGAGSDSTQIRYAGTFLGWAAVDGTNGLVSAVQVAPGKIKASDFSLQVPLGGGFHIDLVSRGIGVAITSHGVPVPVAPNGTILAGGVSETVNTGTLTTTSNVPGVPTQFVDYALNPQPLPVANPAVITTTLADDDDYWRVWTLRFVRPLDSTVVTKVQNTTVTTTEVGAITGSGTLRTRTSYGLWLDRQGMPDLPFADPNPVNGIDNGILFALRLDAAVATQLPWFPDPQNPQGWMLELPAAGTEAAIVVETTPRLTSGTWSPVAASDISTGAAEIPVGSTGTVRFLGRAGEQFFRLVAKSPSGW